jgi:predicted ester cyclase
VTFGNRIRAANEDLLKKGRIAAVREIFAPGYVVHLGGADLRGPEFIEGFVTELRAAFPDLRYEIEILAEAGDRVAWLRTHTGTHKRDLMGIPASGRRVSWRDMVVTRHEAGRIAEEWAVTDLGERLRAA